MFNDFLKTLGAETKAVTMILGCFSIAVSFTALFGSILHKKFPLRSIALFGGTIYFLGSFLTAFARSVEYLMITYGLMQGKLNIYLKLIIINNSLIMKLKLNFRYWIRNYSSLFFHFF